MNNKNKHREHSVMIMQDSRTLSLSAALNEAKARFHQYSERTALLKYCEIQHQVAAFATEPVDRINAIKKCDAAQMLLYVFINQRN